MKKKVFFMKGANSIAWTIFPGEDVDFNKAHAGKNIDQLMEDTNNSREIVRSELW
jgi:hypothetical protein